MPQTERDPRQQPLPPQYDVTSFRKRHKLTAADARTLLEQAGDDRSVADSLARIHTTSKAKAEAKAKAAKAKADAKKSA